MPTVAFVSPKGGAGKTTAALVLALELAERGVRVGMIDSDVNKPLLHWAALPNRPERITVHPAPMASDVATAVREARAKRAEWIILDTEGSVRGASFYSSVRPDLVITPLASSQIEALQAIKAAELVNGAPGLGGARGSGRRLTPHLALLTRLPAAVRPRSLRAIVAQLREHGLDMLPTALIEKEAFRLLFMVGGGLSDLEASGAPGVPAARANARDYASAVMAAMATTAAPSSPLSTPAD